MLNKGAKATFVVPSHLAYGEQGNGPIAPFTPIAFDIEVVDIIHAKPGAVVAPAPIAILPAAKPAKK